jgi:hypothetical protein
MLPSLEMSTEATRFLVVVVSQQTHGHRLSISSLILNLSLSAGIPQVYYFGQEGLHNILVIDLLGPCLEDLFEMCGRKFSVKTCVMVAKQMVSCPLERVGYIGL